jgi:dihydroflavonol-4-reductase
LAVEAAARVAGGAEPMLTVEKLIMSKRRMYFTSEKARRELGYRRRPLETAIRDAVHYFRRSRDAAPAVTR